MKAQLEVELEAVCSTLEQVRRMCQKRPAYMKRDTQQRPSPRWNLEQEERHMFEKWPIFVGKDVEKRPTC